jgi:phosphatidate cytidylyltransferase
MSNLSKRVITAVVLLGLLGTALYGLPWPASIVFFGVFLLIGVWEWSGFFAADSVLQRLLFGALVASIAALLLFVEGRDWVFNVLYVGVLYWLIVFLVLLTGAAMRSKLAAALAGGIALLGAWSALVLIFDEQNGAALFIWCLAIVAASDIGAYFTGRSIGRNKLAPSISPGKTIEGFAGGMLAAGVVAALIAALTGHSAVFFGFVGMLVAAISVVGDLWVSRFKRAAGLKDSGVMLPGHGGVLDRVDSLLAALPLFAIVVLMARQATETVAGT